MVEETKTREINFDSLKTMITYIIDTKDLNIIDEYAYRLLTLAKDFDNGVKHIIPKISYGSKTYYGKKLEILNGIVFVDGTKVEENELHFSGNVVIENVGSKVPNIKIIGDLKADTINTSAGICCDELHAKTINVGCGLHCDDVYAESINAQTIFADNINPDKQC